MRGRGNGYIREASPLFNSPDSICSLKGEEEEILERSITPLLLRSPFLLLFLRERARGIGF